MFKKPTSKHSGKNPIASAIEASGKEIAKKSSEKVSEALVLAVVGSVLPAGVGGVVAAVSAGAVSKLVETLLKQADNTRQLLEALALEPFKTGSRIVQTALTLPISSADHRAFRDGRLMSGVTKLEEALSLAGDADSKMAILLLLGLAEIVLAGGQHSAQNRFNMLAEAASSQLDLAREQLASIQAVEEPTEEIWRERQARYSEAVSDDAFSELRRPPASPASRRTAAERDYKAYLEQTKPNRETIEQLLAVHQLASAFAERAACIG